MITTWTLQFFKSVCDKTTLEMAPLTIFAGANSSGKSTIIQSLLLITQTLQNPVHSRPVILNGHILRMGTFNDIVSNNNELANILIGFKLIPNVDERESSITKQRRLYGSNIIQEITSIECSFEFSAHTLKKEKYLTQLQPELEESRVKVTSELRGDLTEDEVHIKRSNKDLKRRLEQYKLAEDNLQKIEIDSLEYEVINPKKIVLQGQAYQDDSETKIYVGASLNHFLPENLSVVFDALEEQSKLIVSLLTFSETSSIHPKYYSRRNRVEFENSLNDKVKKIVLDILEEPSSLTNLNSKHKNKFIKSVEELKNDFTLDNLRRCYEVLSFHAKPIRRTILQNMAEKSGELLEAIKAEHMAEYTIDYINLPGNSNLAVKHIKQFFTQFVKYLGPLRDEPKPLYSLAGTTDSKDIGFRGEHTAAVLEAHRSFFVEYIPSEEFESRNAIPTPTDNSLEIAVLDWLNYMGVASAISTFDRGKLGHELKIATSGDCSLHDLTHVGVGVSQVLPILVQSLLAEKGSTLIFEQPELHLHPRVQTRLADFFISMTMLKKQCIVETHSEYLINRLRYRSAISKGDEFSKKVIIYFVENLGGKSTYRPIKINEFCVIEDWPKGFFDESEENARAILKAAMDKRKNETR